MKCKNCGKEFTRTHARQVHCSHDCCIEYMNKRGKARYAKKRAENRVVKMCVICGKPLPPNKKLLCSPECALIHKKKYEAEAWQRQKEERKSARLRRKKEREMETECTIKQEKHKKPALSTAQINALARSEGLSYGQYCAKHGLYDTE